jgi:hypothetical protein
VLVNLPYSHQLSGKDLAQLILGLCKCRPERVIVAAISVS